MNLLIYVPLLSPRIKYIFSFIFNDVLKAEIDFTINKEEFTRSDLPKFSYAEQPIGDELFFKSRNLLFEHKITAQHIKKTKFGEMKVPFSVGKGALPFDLFAASFYFLSRYEEYIHYEDYIHFKKQKNMLYPFGESLQHKLNVLNFPVIDDWALILKNILLNHFPSLTFGKKHFSFYPVYIHHPVDQSKNKTFIPRAIASIKSFIDHKLNAKAIQLVGIRQIIAEMQNNGSIENPDFIIPDVQHEHHFIAELQIPKSYIKLSKRAAKSDYSMYYPNHPGFRAGTCTPFFWYDLQLEKKTQILLHPPVTADISLLKNKSTEVLLLQMNELISSVKLVNGDFYFLSLCNDIRPQ